MFYKPTILINPHDKPIEFFMSFPTPYTHYRLEAGEKKMFDPFVADYAVNNLNAGLKVYDPENDDAIVTKSDVSYEDMPWRELVALASARGLFNPGMKRDKVIEVLVNADGE